ncbi:OLC1v1009258C1 [Oldenlandia corymbosa var. corymbosa]|uniref:arginine--tRNA ligase n=1 Tax=Oldenlandia corymbosa var. corymbosa TaxID=529605 RepID=A0AAV1DNL6_OLDCO|nr:OLC1v1009258C1 [Oldenlandia corymbosa var. corymbosa]
MQQCDYQLCRKAIQMPEFSNPMAIGQAIMKNLPASDMIDKCSVAGGGYVNVLLSSQWMANRIQNLLLDAKELHVGHIRSTVIGDTLARLLEFSNVEFLRRNHVGDWGTQFGMLLELLFGNYPDNWEDAVSSLSVGDLEKLYREAYNRVLGLLDHLIVEDQGGARVIFVEGEKQLVVVKSGGGYNYSSTDLAALWYRLNVEKGEWITYVTDAGQKEHFEKLFSAARIAGWLPATADDDDRYPKVSHVKFGCVKNADGSKFKTRSADVIKLVDLLDEAKTRSNAALVERGKAKEWTAEELEETAEAVGYGAVKYADLKNNISTDYTFDLDKMLNDKGDTAVYLLYAHARICSIMGKSGKDIEELKKVGTVVLDHPAEVVLGLHLVQFPEVVEDACTKMLPHILCEYLYHLAESFMKFYNKCPVVGATEETSRLLLCEATGIVMRKCFHLLGITPVQKL